MYIWNNKVTQINIYLFLLKYPDLSVSPGNFVDYPRAWPCIICQCGWLIWAWSKRVCSNVICSMLFPTLIYQMNSSFDWAPTFSSLSVVEFSNLPWDLGAAGGSNESIVPRGHNPSTQKSINTNGTHLSLPNQYILNETSCKDVPVPLC